MEARPTLVELHLGADGTPKWETIDFDLPCSRCGYDLRMLTVARCPECGLAFSWREVLTAREQQDPWLLEFGWRKWPVRSLLYTWGLSLSPWHFWRRASIHDRIRSGPLVFLLLVSGPLLLMAYLGSMAGLGVLLAAVTDAYYLPGLMAIADIAEDVGSLLFEAGAVSIWTGMMVIALVVQAATLASLRETLGRCRVRTVQILRVAGYTAFPIAVGWMVMAHVLVGISRLLPMSFRWEMFVAQIAMMSMPVLVPTVVLGYPLRRYLELPRAWLLALAAGIIGYLTAAVVLVGIANAGRL